MAEFKINISASLVETNTGLFSFKDISYLWRPLSKR